MFADEKPFFVMYKIILRDSPVVTVMLPLLKMVPQLRGTC